MFSRFNRGEMNERQRNENPPGGPIIRILIADDSDAILDGLATLLNQTSGFQVVGLADDGLQAVEKARELLPDVVIMDAQMPNMDGVEATRRIKRELPGIGVLFFSVFADYLEASVAAGSDGYLNKDCSPSELFNEIKRIAALSSGRLSSRGPAGRPG